MAVDAGLRLTTRRLSSTRLLDYWPYFAPYTRASSGNSKQ